MDIKEIIDTYKHHTTKYTCDKYDISKYLLYKLLDDNGITKHTTSETTKLSKLENPNQGTGGRIFYNNGTEQGRFKPGTQPDG